jgi:Sigma-70, region 4
MPLSFDQLVTLLDQPPFEPCDNELQYLTRIQYDRAFTEAVRLHYRRVKHLIVHLTGNWAVHFRAPLLMLVEGKSYKQIVKLTRTNEGTVKSRVYRAKVLLRRRLSAYLDGVDRTRA